MKIRFLKNCEAPQQYMKRCGDGCCSWPEWETGYFSVGEEIDPENPFGRVDLSSLKYREDFEILEYP
jgi:hypothetical protein